MKGFDVKFMEELKRKNDLVDVIGRYVRLEQRGGNFWGKCPFHHEKTASFSVNSVGQFFYCFGCHKSGDVISFIMEIEFLIYSSKKNSLNYLQHARHCVVNNTEFTVPMFNGIDEK